MAGFTYTILTGTKATEGSIKFWGNHVSIPADQVLSEAEAFIYSRLRAREMIATAEISVAADASTFPLPTGFIEPIKLLPDGWGEPMPFTHENLLGRIRNTDGTLETGEPSEWTIANEQGEFDSQLTDALEATMWYYKTPTALSVSNETNFLTTRYPTLVRYACTAFAYDHRKRRTDASEMRMLAMNEINEANSEADRGRRGQVRLR
tara:strand:+ start:1084 stop:1704 length:621 start_codon:yes stop_codon:yes gene_type:complete